MSHSPDDHHAPPTGALPEFGGVDGFTLPAQTELRSPRRSDVATVVVHAAIADIEPTIWRRLELASDLGLPQLHEVLQAAFGWTNSHLHLFEKGERPGAFQAYLMNSSLDEGMTGTAESEVRLDEVLGVVGDTLTYEYDFGDGWEHTLTLEAITDRAPGSVEAVCIAGARSGPPEDCGGAPGYENLLRVLADPAHPRHDTLREWLRRDLDPEAFDLDRINGDLQAVHQRATARQTVPAGVLEVLDQLSGPTGDEFWRLAIAADLGAGTEIDLETAEEMTANYRWWLHRIGDGITLSAAGYLPPAVAKELGEQLNLRLEVRGPLNRESNIEPMRDFRESARAMGLTKTTKGTLTTTPLGRRLARNPIALWQHIAGRVPVDTHAVARIAGGLYLLQVSAGDNAKTGYLQSGNELIAEALTELGWRTGDGDLFDHRDIQDMIWDIRIVLTRAKAVIRPLFRFETTETEPSEPAPRGGILLARQALNSLG